MARVTVEDCRKLVPNRFELVLVASQRANNISSGAPLTIAGDNEKYTVIALREIAANTIDADSIKKSLISGLQQNCTVDEELEDLQETNSDPIENEDYPDVDFQVSDDDLEKMDFSDNIDSKD